MYSNKAKYAHRSVDIGNIGDIGPTNVGLQNCILLKRKCEKKNAPPPPLQSPTPSYGLGGRSRNIPRCEITNVRT